MGQNDFTINRTIDLLTSPPGVDEVEISLFGPGYGECIVVHLGDHKWIVVDSCIGADVQPTALTYLQNLGLDPSDAVRLIVATHWHDDHIRGMSTMLKTCQNADFCCSIALLKEEFIARVRALEKSPATLNGSGTRELYRVSLLLSERSVDLVYAVPNRLLFKEGECEVWSLSPSDAVIDAFLQQIKSIVPKDGEAKRRIPTLTPNHAAVVLWVRIGDDCILLGADLERNGWVSILDTLSGNHHLASVFKVAHHGSEDAHNDRIWEEMLSSEPIAVLTPWRLAGRELPNDDDVKRILSFTPEAYSTAKRQDNLGRPKTYQNSVVEKTIRESGIRIRSLDPSPGIIRLRKKAHGKESWSVERFGSACPLSVY